MAFFDAWESNQLRRSARLSFNDAAEPDEMEPDAKRQKTSTIDLEAEYNLIPVYSDTADTPLSDLELQPIKREVTVIKREDWVFTDGNDILDEIQDLENVHSSNDTETLSNHTDRLSTTEVLEENVQPSNSNETLSNHTGTLSTMEALELAERYIDEYAGPDTRTLEDRRKDFKAGKIHSNKHCLRCLGTNANVKCRSCPRVYHWACLPDEQAESIRAMLAREQSPDLGEEHQVSIYCPLCYKRLFSCLRLQSDLTPAAREQRVLIIAHQLKRLPERVEWMKLHDDGSLLSDRRLLEDLGQNFRTWSARYRP